MKKRVYYSVDNPSWYFLVPNIAYDFIFKDGYIHYRTPMFEGVVSLNHAENVSILDENKIRIITTPHSD